MTDELGWEHAIESIPDAGLQVERTATAEERQAIAQALDLLACTSLNVRYTLMPRAAGHFRLAGSLEAEIEQSCVVTLEPLSNKVSDSFSVDYWPETQIPEPAGGVIDVHDEPDLEPIVMGRITVGRVVFECLASAIDLYPRKPGVAFETPEAPASNGDGSTKVSPFAVLARMKSKP